MTDEDDTIYISPLAYLRSVWTLFYTCIRHPFLYTAIDLTTGRIVRQQREPFTAEDLDDG